MTKWKAKAYFTRDGEEILAFKSRTEDGLYNLISKWKHDQLYFRGKRNNTEESEIDAVIQKLRIVIEQ